MSLTLQKSEKYSFFWWTRTLCLVVLMLLLFLSSASAVMVKLAWDPSADASGYRIYYGKASRTYTKSVDVGTATSFGLDLPMEKWYITLTAYDAYGNESDFSAEVSWPIQLFSPAPGEVIYSGSSYTAEWYASSSVSSFNLYHSMDGGVTWIPVDEQVTGTRSYNWAVPTPGGNRRNCLLKVVGFDAAGNRLAGDIPDGPFTIEVARLVSPNGGEVLTSGNFLPVTWQTHSTKSMVAETEVRFTKDGGATWETVYRMGGNPGRFDWDVPDVEKSRKQCRLKVFLKDSDGKTVGMDASDGYFTIIPIQ